MLVRRRNRDAASKRRNAVERFNALRPLIVSLQGSRLVVFLPNHEET